MNKFKIIIYWSEEDQVFIAEVPELPGCMTHGDTEATALTNAKEAVQAWINTANEFGDPIPKPERMRLTSNKLVNAKYGSLIGGNKAQVRRNNALSYSYAKAVRPIVNPEVH
ncbi:MAG TPA: type II toxin-antitoxin system HicB family antitoxin [Pyrinomonadaceae bacterium]|jgi:predicted RNase H-like HicB family nuclease